MRRGISFRSSVLGWLAGVFVWHASPPDLLGYPGCEDSGEQAELDCRRERPEARR